jgi:hypothetical protein
VLVDSFQYSDQLSRCRRGRTTTSIGVCLPSDTGANDHNEAGWASAVLAGSPETRGVRKTYLSRGYYNCA